MRETSPEITQEFRASLTLHTPEPDYCCTVLLRELDQKGLIGITRQHVSRQIMLDRLPTTAEDITCGDPNRQDTITEA